MKSIKSIIAIISGVLLLLTGCEPHFDTPPMIIPQASQEANTTIMALKTAFQENLDSIGYKSVVNNTATPYIIEGVVIANDESGNLFKQMVIQDATSAITLAIDQSNLYNTYRVGQKIVLNCTGLYIGKNNGLQQLGYLFNNGIGRMSQALFESKVELSGLPDAAIDTLQVTLGSLPQSGLELLSYQSQLIELKSVYFTDGGNLPFADSNSSASRTLKDTLGYSIVVRTSNYSNFATDILPEGLGDVIAILSYHGSDYQLLIPQRSNVFNFTGTAVPVPPDDSNSESSPYSIAEAFKHSGDTAVWVKGYIVGNVNGQVFDTGCVFAPPFTAASNIILADALTETNPDNCMPVQLPYGDIRTALSLVSNPDNYHQSLLLKCDLSSYFSVPGIKNVTQYQLSAPMAGIKKRK